MALLNKGDVKPVVIGFWGSNSDDIILYLSSIINNLGKKVAVFDFSESQSVKYLLPFYSQDQFSYNNIDIYMNKSIEDSIEQYKDKYEYILINYSFDIISKTKFLQQCDYRILVTDMQKINVTKVKTLSDEIDGEKYELVKIVRDVVDSKIFDYINKLLHSESFDYISEYALGYDEEEMTCRIENQYNQKIKFNKIPKDFKNMLLEIIMMIGFEKKETLKALKNAERGM